VTPSPKNISWLSERRKCEVWLRWGSPRAGRAPRQHHVMEQEWVRQPFAEAPFLYVPLPDSQVIIQRGGAAFCTQVVHKEWRDVAPQCILSRSVCKLYTICGAIILRTNLLCVPIGRFIMQSCSPILPLIRDRKPQNCLAVGVPRFARSSGAARSSSTACGSGESWAGVPRAAGRSRAEGSRRELGSHGGLSSEAER